MTAFGTLGASAGNWKLELFLAKDQWHGSLVVIRFVRKATHVLRRRRSV